MDSDFKLTERTAEQVIAGLARDRFDGRPFALLNPTAGTKIITPGLDRKIRKALRRAAYRITFFLYLRLPILYVRKLALEVRKSRNHAMRYFLGHLAKFVEQSHRAAS
jgi:hypothetical protein